MVYRILVIFDMLVVEKALYFKLLHKPMYLNDTELWREKSKWVGQPGQEAL